MSLKNNILSVESGEGAFRRPIIQGLIIQLIGVHGKKCIGLSIDPQITKAYLALLPSRLKQRIYSLGSFQTFLTVSAYVRDLHEELFLNPENNHLIYELYTKILFPIQERLIEDLKKQQFVVILDRSKLSSYAYYCSIPSIDAPPLYDILAKAKEQLVGTAVPAFFIESNMRMTYDLAKAKKYDLIAPQLNLKLKSWFSSLKSLVSSQTEEEALITFISPQTSVPDAIHKIVERIK